MNCGDRFRQTLPESRRVVVKVGSRVIVGKTGRPDMARIRSGLAACVMRRSGYEVVVVSSGAWAWHGGA